MGKAHGIEMIRVGTFKDLHGKDVKIESRDLDEMVDNFGKAHDVAMVLGHKIETDTPAVGWLERVYRVGDKLLGDVGSIPVRIATALRDKQFKKVSLGLSNGYRDVKGWTIRHVGLLGANPPAVDGLADFPTISCAAADAATFGVESEIIHGEVTTVTRNEAVKILQDAKVNAVLFSVSVADETVIALAEEIKKREVPPKLDNGDPTPPPPPAKAKEMQIDPGVALAEAKSMLAEGKALKEEFHAKVIEGRKERLTKALEAAVKTGRMAPAEVAGYRALAEGMIGDTEQVVALAEGKSKVTAFDAIIASIEARPQMAVFGELAPEKLKEEADTKKAKTIEKAKAFYKANEADLSTAQTCEEYVEGILLSEGFEAEKKKDKDGK